MVEKPSFQWSLFICNPTHLTNISSNLLPNIFSKVKIF